jgi:Uma2 family endonuclease
MSAVLSQKQISSLHTYHQIEEASEVRHEYHDGEIIAMSGGTIDHALIIRNLIILLHIAFQDSDFSVFGGDLRIWIPEHNRGLYPDLSVFNGEVILNNDRRDEVINPCWIFEVLSDSTEAYDRGQKFRFYRSIPNFNNYFLVSQTEPLIEHYQRTDNDRWLFSTKQGLDRILELPNNRSISLSEIYKGLKFN